MQVDSLRRILNILKKFETDFARKGLAEKGLSPAGLRQQIWALQNEVLAELLQDHGVRLIPPPAGTMTETGFLDPMYYAQDATHANWEYGQKILESLEGLLATSPRES